MKTTTATKTKLPTGINVSDTKYPSYKSKDKVAWGILPNNSYHINMVNTDRFGWCIATLSIGKDRSYGISVDDGKIVSMGVADQTRKITVYIRQSRVESLQKYIDLFKKGLDDANSIRDRISTRRSNTIMRRSMMSSSLFGF